MIRGYTKIESEVELKHVVADLVMTNPDSREKIIIDWKYSCMSLRDVVKNSKE